MRKSAFTIKEMIDLWNNPKKQHIRKSDHDIIEKNRGGISYYLYGNEIAFYNPEQETISISDGGFKTTTTSNRLHGLGLYNYGISVVQRKFIWYISTDNHKTFRLWDDYKPYIFKVTS